MAAPTPFAPLRYVDAPALVPHLYGLFSVASVIEPAEEHWATGVEWEPISCEPATIMGVGCSGQSLLNVPKPYLAQPSRVNGTPFGVYGSWKCSPIGHWDDAESRAMQHLLAGEERAVERAIYLGEAGNTGLIDASTVDVTPVAGTAISVTQGLGLLESHLALHHSGLGMIHANPREVTKLVHERLISDDLSTVQQLRTRLGTPVASEGGMAGTTGPGAAATPANTFWIYASGIPQIRRTAPVVVSPRESALNRSNNDLSILVERIYVAAWQCASAAVLVTATGA